MTAKKRRRPHTLLDELERTGAIIPPIAEDLRKLHSKLQRQKWEGPFSENEIKSLNFVFNAVMTWPVRSSSLRIYERNRWIAEECAYYKARGDSAARKRTADLWGESVRTVDRARRQHPMSYDAPIKPNADTLDFFEAARGVLGSPSAKSKFRERVGHKLH